MTTQTDKALARATESLNAAREKLAAMQRATDPKKFEALWSEFLSEIQRVFNRLGSACKGEGKREAWFGLIKHDRKSDDLLRYVHNARHADEHGIDRITAATDGRITITSTGSSTIKSMSFFDTSVGPQMAFEGQGSPLTVKFNPWQVSLVVVKNQGVTYPVPMQHLGTPLQPPVGCLAVGHAALDYCTRKLDEARTRFGTAPAVRSSP